jgi:hypothetical protein
MNFKVCSCPKRDKEKEEADVGQQMQKKRKNGIKTKFTLDSSNFKMFLFFFYSDGTSTYPHGKKPSKVLMKVKDEPTTPPLEDDQQREILTPRPTSTTPAMGLSVTIDMPNAEALKDLMKAAHNIVAGQMVTNQVESMRLAPYLKKVRKQMGKLLFSN